MAVGLHFLDSGAFGLRKENPDAAAYRAYLDRYARFVKRYAGAVDLYANVDVIGDAARTRDHQRHLEREHGLQPVPVVHYGPHGERELEYYLGGGYRLIGLGGLVGKTVVAQAWVGRCFRRAGRVRLHGFGVVNYRLLVNFPWWSVDSAAWAKEGGRWGAIFVPRSYGGEYTVSRPPFKIVTRCEARKGGGRRGDTGAIDYLGASGAERRYVDGWLASRGVRYGDDPEGVNRSRRERFRANVYFFEWLRARLPGRPRVFYSGGDDVLANSPENFVPGPVDVMLTFHTLLKKRFRSLCEARRGVICA